MQPQINTMVVTAPLKIAGRHDRAWRILAFVPRADRADDRDDVLQKVAARWRSRNAQRKRLAGGGNEAKDQGQFAYSQELTAAMTLAASLRRSLLCACNLPSGFRAFLASVASASANAPSTPT